VDKLIVKVLGTPIGGVSDVDGDGDGFRTGPGGKDNIPVAPKQLKRTLQEKIKDGPLNFVAGLDNERKIPRVFGDEEALSRYGSTRKGMQEYALTKYGVSLSFAEETKEQKTSRIKNIKNGLAQSRPDLSKGEIAQLANSINRQINERLKLTKELWRYLENIDAEETEKDIELRTATYPMFYEQASQMLAEIHGAMQGLEDVLSNISLSDADKAKLSVEFSVFDFENPDAEIEGFVKVQREED